MYSPSIKAATDRMLGMFIYDNSASGLRINIIVNY